MAQHEVIRFLRPSKNALLIDLGRVCQICIRRLAIQHTLKQVYVLSAKPGQETGEAETYRLISNDRYLSLSNSTLHKLILCVSAQEEQQHLSASEKLNGIREV